MNEQRLKETEKLVKKLGKRKMHWIKKFIELQFIGNTEGDTYTIKKWINNYGWFYYGIHKIVEYFPDLIIKSNELNGYEMEVEFKPEFMLMMADIVEYLDETYELIADDELIENLKIYRNIKLVESL